MKDLKNSVAVALVIMGGLLIVAPLVSDHLHRQQVVEALRQPGIDSITLQPELSPLYRLGCWLTGTACLGAGMLFARQKKSGPDTP